MKYIKGNAISLQEEMRKLSKCGVEEVGRLEISEKTNATLEINGGHKR